MLTRRGYIIRTVNSKPEKWKGSPSALQTVAAKPNTCNNSNRPLGISTLVLLTMYAQSDLLDCLVVLVNWNTREPRAVQHRNDLLKVGGIWCCLLTLMSPLLVCSTAASFQVCQFHCRLLMRLHVLFLFIIVHSILHCCSHLYCVFIQALFVCNGKQTKHQKITEHTETNILQVMPKVHSGTVNYEDKKLKLNNTVLLGNKGGH